MLWTVTVLSLALALAKAQNSGKCEVGPWTEWGNCTTNRDKTTSENLDRSFPKDPSIDGEDLDLMRQGMFDFPPLLAQRRQCVIDGDCLNDLRRPRDGEHKCKDGLAGDIPCLNVDQLAFLNIANLGHTQEHGPPDPYVTGADCWGWTDPETNDEYAIMGTSGGTSFVRLTDPANPVVVAFMTATPGTNVSFWKDIKVVNDHAFVASEALGHGLQVFDLSRLRSLQDLVYLEADAIYTGFGQAHNLVGNDETNFLYVVGSRWDNHINSCHGGLLALDVSKPKEPRFAGCFGEDGFTHDAHCVVYKGPDNRYKGREICFATNLDSLTIVDVENKTNMVLISKTSYNNATSTHQGWLTEDHTIMLIDDEMDELDTKQLTTYIWDVKDLKVPVLRHVYRPEITGIDHNQYIKGKFVYQANYQLGLRILYLDQEAFSLQEVAYFDVYPAEDTFSFAGIWNVYPFFTSGTLILSTLEQGLYIVRPDYKAMDEAVRTHETFPRQTRYRSYTSRSPDVSCPALVETRPCPTTSNGAGPLLTLRWISVYLFLYVIKGC